MSIHRDELIRLIKNSVATLEVLVQSKDFYARRGDFDIDYISYIDPVKLIENLENSGE